MDCAVVFVLILFVAALLLVLAMRRASRSRQAYLDYRRVAIAYHGTVRRTGWFGLPDTRFFHGSAQVKLRAFKTGGAHGRPLTQVVVDWPEADISCDIVTPRNASRPHFAERLIEVATSDRDFDSQFNVRINKAGETRTLLNDAVRLQLYKLQHAGGSTSLRVRLSNGSFTSQKMKVLRQYEDIMDFVQESLELYEQLLLTRARGIEFVAGDEQAQLLEEVECRICGELIEDDLVFCRRCKTPHHRECWYYTGVCSLFGCGEVHFELPVVANRLPSQPVIDKKEDQTSPDDGDP